MVNYEFIPLGMVAALAVYKNGVVALFWTSREPLCLPTLPTEDHVDQDDNNLSSTNIQVAVILLKWVSICRTVHMHIDALAMLA